MYELYWYYMIEDLDKSTIRQVNARALCNILITSSRSYFGGLKNQGKISQFCAVNIRFPTMGARFERRND